MALGSQAELSAPCSELFREAALGGRLGQPDGIKYRLSKSQAHRLVLGASSREEEFWTALALGQCRPSRPWRQGRASEPRALGRLPSVWLERDLAVGWGRGGETSPLTYLYQRFSGAFRVLQVGCVSVLLEN